MNPINYFMHSCQHKGTVLRQCVFDSFTQKSVCLDAVAQFFCIITNTRSTGEFLYSKNVSTPTNFASDNRKIRPRLQPFTLTAHMQFFLGCKFLGNTFSKHYLN